MSISSRYDAALDEAGCAFLQSIGGGLTETGLGMLIVPGFNKAGAIAFGAGALTTYASSILCPYTEGGKGSGGDFCDVNMEGVCTLFEKGEGGLYQEYDGAETPTGSGNYVELVAIGCDKYGPGDADSKGYYATYRDIKFTSLFSQGEVETSEVILYYKQSANPTLFSKPINANDPNVPNGECTTKPRLEPWEGQDAQDCDITVQGLGMGATPGGNIAPIMLVEPGHQKQKWIDEKQWENPPGVINPAQAPSYQNTCSFAPTLIYPTPGGEPVVVPIEPGEDIQDALDRLGSEMNDRFDDTDSALDGINDKLDDIIDDIPDSPGAPIDIPGGTVTFKAVCDTDDQGNPEEVEYELGAATTTNEALVQIYSNQTKLFAMIQQHLNWKTPICDPDDCELEGEMRTISFRSSETSPFGKSRLRKRLRYRSGSGIGRDALVDHWRLFVWNAGPVRVIHTGSSCGTPSVWAANELEGKRVLRHAFAEAGIDPDQVGRWKTCSSDNARLGVPGEMSVDTTGGYYWITERDGSDARPLVAKT